MAVLQTAISPVVNGTTALTLSWSGIKSSYLIMAFLYFTDFQDSKRREFDVSFNGISELIPHNPKYLDATCVYSSSWYRVADGEYNFTLTPTNTLVLPPILNAYELYNLITHDTPTTFPEVSCKNVLHYGTERVIDMQGGLYPEKHVRWSF
uniref:Malectin-like domain-containing protein n=1 Tax=Aegilops tauschii TaxID=37682 RepID=M8BPR0_AEGTA